MIDLPSPPDGYRPCVGIAVVNPSGLVWAGERIDSPGAWQMPQGGIDPGETIEEAGLRELREETGLTPGAVTLTDRTADWITYDLPPELAGKLWKGRYKGQAQVWLRLSYAGPDEAVDLTLHQQEFSRWDWLSAPALMAQIVPFKREVYRAALSGLGLLPSP